MEATEVAMPYWGGGGSKCSAIVAYTNKIAPDLF